MKKMKMMMMKLTRCMCEDDIDVFKGTEVDEKFVDWYGRKKQWLENGVAKRKTINRFSKLNL